MGKKPCLCGLDETGLRRDIVCPKHDGEFLVTIPKKPLPGGKLTANDWAPREM